AIKDVYQRTGYLLDPHSAVGYLGALESDGGTAVVLSTAHPAKFKETVDEAIQTPIGLPPALQEAARRRERFLTIEADYRALKEYLEA
ncbi:MAG: threonine synthase, partial [Vicinamibacteria bacterium]